MGSIFGFGSNLVAVALGAHVYPIHYVVSVMVLLSVFVTGYIAFRYRKNIAYDLLLKRIFPFMASGLLIGLFLYPMIRGIAFKKRLGVLVFIFAARELFSSLRKLKEEGGIFLLSRRHCGRSRRV